MLSRNILFNDFQDYTSKNIRSIYISCFYLVVAYGYFICNWSISGDSEVFSMNESYWSLLSQGKILMPFVDLLINQKILPFWDDLFSIIILFTSGLVLCTGLYRVNKNKRSLLIFLLVYLVSPIYVFYLRFTTFNVSVSIGMLLISLSLYFYVVLLDAHYVSKKLLTVIILLACCAISIYQMFAAFLITGILFVALQRLTFLPTNLHFKHSVKPLKIGIIIIILSVLCYKVFCSLVYLYIEPASGYPNSLMQWGKLPAINILKNLILYFNHLFLHSAFNWFCSVTISCYVIFVSYLLLIKKSYYFVVLTLAFVLSAFFMPIILGSGLVLRTVQQIPLMLAGLWLLMYSFSNDKIKKMIVFLICISSLLNAQFITRLFYGDAMRLQSDIDFANQIYSRVVDQVGSSINKKPLVILGHHSNKEKPFILKSAYYHFGDSIGVSFFENGEYWRMQPFMSWLGDDFIMASSSQYESATVLASNIPSYPDKGSVIETNEMIILKISAYPLSENQAPIHLDLQSYHKIDISSVNSSFDFIASQDGIINFGGWSYIKQADASRTEKFIHLVGLKENYIFPVNESERPDVAALFKDGKNLENSGFYGTLNNKNLAHGDYRVFLILINGSDYVEIDSEKDIVF